MAGLSLMLLAAPACTPKQYAQQADQSAYGVLAQRQKQALGQTQAFDIRYSPMSVSAAGEGLVGQSASGETATRETANAASTANATSAPASRPGRVLTLHDCLQVAARNNRALQTRKEQLFTSALALANLRHTWSRVFGNITGTGAVSRVGDETTYEGSGQANLSFAQKFANGGALALGAGLEAATNFLGIRDTTFGSLLEANFTQPLLRGGWNNFAYEPLYRAERNFAISILEYERFTQTLATDIATQYYRVLQQADQLSNEQENLRRLEDTFKFVQAQVEGGMVSRVQSDQAEQNVLAAQVRVQISQQDYRDALDQFKNTLGLPIAAEVELDNRDLEQLSVLPIPFDEDKAVQVALRTRPDVLTQRANLRDAREDIRIAADQFNPQLDLILYAAIPGTAPRSPLRLSSNDFTRSVRLNFDYQLDQWNNRDAYRRSQIAADKAQRDLEEFLDIVRLQVRASYRSLLQSQKTYEIQKASVELATRRTRLATFEQKEGLASTRDVLEAEDALRSSKNALTAALVSYAATRLSFLTRLGMIQVDTQGQLHERSQPFYVDRERTGG